jgi:hypothetical protein
MIACRVLLVPMLALIIAYASYAEEAGKDRPGALPRIDWEDVEGARAYLVEIVQADSELLVASGTVEEPSYELKLPPGSYRLRVTTLNKNLRKELSTPWMSFTLKQPVFPRIDELSPSEIFTGELRTFLVRGSGLSSETRVYLRNEETGAEIGPERTSILSNGEIEITFASPLEPGAYTVLAKNPPDLLTEHRNGLTVTSPPAHEPPSAEALAAALLPIEPTAEEQPSVVHSAPLDEPSKGQPSFEFPPVTVGLGYSASFVFGPWSDMLSPSFLGGEVYLVFHFTPIISGATEIDYVQCDSDPGDGKVSGTLSIVSAALGVCVDLRRLLPIRLRLLGGWGYSRVEADSEISGEGTEREQSGDFFGQCGAALVFPLFSFLSFEAGCDLRSIFYSDEIMFSLRPVIRLGVKL